MLQERTQRYLIYSSRKVFISHRDTSGRTFLSLLMYERLPPQQQHTFSCTQRVSDLSEVITGFEMVFVSILTHNALIMSNVLTSYDQEHHHLLFRCLNDLLAESLQTVIRLKHR